MAGGVFNRVLVVSTAGTTSVGSASGVELEVSPGSGSGLVSTAGTGLMLAKVGMDIVQWQLEIARQHYNAQMHNEI